MFLSLFMSLTLGSSQHISAQTTTLLDQIHDQNLEVYPPSFSPNVVNGQIDPDGMWYATFNYIAIDPDHICEVLALPQGVNYIIWNGSIMQADGSYTIDPNATAITGTTTTSTSLRVCRGFFSRNPIPSISAFDNKKVEITYADLSRMCPECYQLALFPLNSWIMVVAPELYTGPNCPSWQLDSDVTAVYASDQNGKIVWNTAHGTLTSPKQPDRCTILWLFKEPHGQIA